MSHLPKQAAETARISRECQVFSGKEMFFARFEHFPDRVTDISPTILVS
jgi:hypothetical protein